MPIRNVLIVGAGFMGSQIGLQCVLHGCRVTMYDVVVTRDYHKVPCHNDNFWKT